MHQLENLECSNARMRVWSILVASAERTPHFQGRQTLCNPAVGAGNTNQSNLFQASSGVRNSSSDARRLGIQVISRV